ncbi:MAG: hypothetical protein ACK47M_04180, partial [Caldilinea sp.]
PVRRSVMEQVQQAATPVEKQRWETLAAAIECVVIPPKFGRYPLVEEVLWKTVQAAMIGAMAIDDALHKMTVQIADIVAGDHAR